MLGHITYLSDESMAKKFGRDLKQDKINFNFDVEFQIESYLRYQGEKFVTSFDANTYLLMTKALDYFDPFNETDFIERMSKSKSRFLVISFTSDWRFPPRRSEEIVKTLIKFNKDVSYACIKSDGGHDAFLMKNDNYFEIMRTYIEANMMARKDFDLITEWVEPDSRILDLGCGDGSLLKLLNKKNISGYGVDTSIDKTIKSLDNKINIINADINDHMDLFQRQEF